MLREINADMDVSYLTYPFLFIAIFFESFLLVTFLSAPARKQRTKEVSEHTPNVAVIVPCWNEESTIKGTVDSLLALEYPKDKLTIVLVNDGSKDGTARVMDGYIGNPQITVIHKENGGKHTAVNLGIEKSPQAEFFGCLDADSFVSPEALREIIGHFENPKVAAVTAAMSVHEPKTLLELMQNAEYIFGIALRHTISSVNGLYVTPGPFSFYRRQTILDLGGFRKGHNTEDLEMALRIQRGGFLIENAPRARVYTKTPKTVPSLIKQRVRWTTGFLRNVIYDYRDLIGNPHFGTLGMVVLPLGLFAIVSGIFLFFFVIFRLIRHVVTSYLLTSGVPLSYTLLPHWDGIEWFYIPVTGIVLLALIAMIGSVSFMIVGKKISGTPSNLSVGVITYILFYGVIAPFWLIRTVYDVLTGTRRSWR
jgi:cellulose synthase/poly-beta-1,6-N-acetylglucosamine synthase-like glycosyltransferase